MKMNTNIDMAIKHCQFMKDRYWRDLQRCESLLKTDLSNLSVKSEEELTKKDLLLLITRNCDYMSALNLYNYYKEELNKVRAQKHLNRESSNNERR